MNSPTSQILMPLAMVLVTIMTIVLFAVHHANRQIPGLQSWARSYLCGLLLAIALLARHHAPEWLLPVVTAVLTFLATWLNVAATRAYTGRSPWQPAYLALALAIMLGLSIHLSWWQPNPTLRLALVFGVNGTLMLLSARAMFTAGMRLAPERYLFTLACGAQGLSVLTGSLILLIGHVDLSDSERFRTVFQYVVLSSIVMLVMRAFGVVMLANAHITAELRHFAERDPLTSIYNRRSFMTLLDKSVNLMHALVAAGTGPGPFQAHQRYLGPQQRGPGLAPLCPAGQRPPAQRGRDRPRRRGGISHLPAQYRTRGGGRRRRTAARTDRITTGRRPAWTDRLDRQHRRDADRPG